MRGDGFKGVRVGALTALAALVAVAAGVAFGDTEPKPSPAQEPVQVMVLGSYHMDNPGRDVHNLEADDVLAPKRQKELAELAERLAEFRPTKIAVEVPFSSDKDEGAKDRKHSRFVDQYGPYLKGEMEPNRNEVVQVGFRLAKKLGHERVYGIDSQGPFPYGKMAAWAEENGQGGLLKESEKEAKDLLGGLAALLKEKSVAECFAAFNDPAFVLRTHQMYLKYFAPIGGDGEYPGADLVEGWYGRNLRIFVNLGRISEPGDRILVLYGAGHAYYLRQLALETPGFELVEAGPLLEEARNFSTP